MYQSLDFRAPGCVSTTAGADSSGIEPKPRLVFFRDTKPGLPQFVKIHLAEHLQCLQLSFDVTVVDGDCDYDRVCDRIQPDLALFESGAYTTDHRRTIANTHTHPGVPKVGLINADAYCLSRVAFISDMDRWGVESLFTISVSMPEYTPELDSRLYVWPNFIDPGTFRDYGAPKVVPVLFTGSQAPHYPWRNQVALRLSQVYPTMSSPHFGWFTNEGDARMVTGERYARLLNASLLVPTCGTIAKEVVRKHFEIPASRACLVTERTEALEMAGFVDMVNCVFADPSDVVDKVDHLFSNPDQLQAITDGGWSLAHARHTALQRDHIYQWYRLNQVRRPDQRIRQDSPFEPLALAPVGSANRRPSVESTDGTLLRQGDEALRRNDVVEARRLYLRGQTYHYLPGAVLRLAIASLVEGQPVDALAWVSKNLDRISREFATDPDPVDWAYFIRTLLCSGDLQSAASRAREFPDMGHIELGRIRSVLALLGDYQFDGDQPARSRPSIHDLPALDEDQWLKELLQMLHACGQTGLAEVIELGGRRQGDSPSHTPPGHSGAVRSRRALASESQLTEAARSVQSFLARHLPRPQAEPHLAALTNLAEKLPISSVAVVGEDHRGSGERLKRRIYGVAHLGWMLPPSSPTAALSLGLERNPNGRVELTALDSLDPPSPHVYPVEAVGGDEAILRTGASGDASRSGRADVVAWLTLRTPSSEETARIRHTDVVIVSHIDSPGGYSLYSILNDDPDFGIEIPATNGSSLVVFRRLPSSDVIRKAPPRGRIRPEVEAAWTAKC